MPCIPASANGAARGDFLCPVDRVIIKVNQPLGVDTFAVDYKAKELIEVYGDILVEQKNLQQRRSFLGSSMLDDSFATDNGNMEFESAIMKVDVGLQRLNEAVKDLKHSSAMSQRSVTDYFKEISSRLKDVQKKLLDDISSRSQIQLDNIEFEKYRLIEMKKSLHDRLVECYDEEITKPFGNPTESLSEMSLNSSTLSNGFPDAVDGENSDICVGLLNCHVGQHLIDFNPNKNATKKLEEGMCNMGKIVCDFELNVSLSRDLRKLGQYPVGLVLGSKEDLSANTSENIMHSYIREPRG